MKSIIVMVMLALVSACSSTPVKTSQTADGGTKIRVTATGSTFEEAKSIAFNRAIEYVVGSVIVNEKESRNDKLARNEILNHSSGYVDDFTVIKSTSSGKSVTVEMDVVIKNSRIANRILNSTTGKESNINGSRMATQYGSYLDSRQSANNIVVPILNDFPARSYMTEQVRTEFGLDVFNNARLLVAYKVSLKYEWVMAMDEALRLASSPRDKGIRQEKIKVIKRKPGDWVGSNDVYYFNDANFYDMVHKKLNYEVSFYGVVKDINGKVIACNRRNIVDIYTGSSIEISNSQPFLVQFDFKFQPSQVKHIDAASSVETFVTLDSTLCNQ